MLRTGSIGMLGRTSRTLAYRIRSTRQISSDDFNTTTNSAYIDEMYSQYLKDPESVHPSWKFYFKNMNNTAQPSASAFASVPRINIPSSTLLGGASSNNLSLHLKVQLLCRAYQVRGNLKASTDPLKLTEKKTPPELTVEYYGFSKDDLETDISLGPGILPNFKATGVEKLKLKDIIKTLNDTYCKSYGIEFTHIPSKVKCDYLRNLIEIPKPYSYSHEDKARILDRTIWACTFESFLGVKFNNDKRFGIEGLEGVIEGIKVLIDESVKTGVEDIVLGCSHRGRLNILSNVVRKPNESIFSEFQGSTVDDGVEGPGDVKYHLGMNYKRPTLSGKYVNLSLVANPSHLESEDPVVLGRTRSILHEKHDLEDKRKALAVLLHGDAAFAGQGIVYETMQLQNLPQYSTGGTIHVITNNQIGFTTDPRFARSTPYPSDLAKAISAPVFHVNANDIEALTFIFSLAAKYRYKFSSDVVIDVVGWRKYGHNEIDEPMFTQPQMYKRIKTVKSVLDAYSDQLVAEKSFTREQIDQQKQEVWDYFEHALESSKGYEPSSREWLTAAWEGFKSPKELATEVLSQEPTNVQSDILKQIGNVVGTWPDDFTPHKGVKRVLNQRKKSVATGKDIDWATGEALAFGSLILEGYSVRVSGEDVERGTFSQRHAVIHDQNSDRTFTPLKRLETDKGDFTIANSSLSEYGIMGFEYGYSLTSPEQLVIWEAQFGDFANEAQVIIDQYFASGEQKWKQRSGLVLSLPHGYDGQGSEHSSGRLERFLQLCNEDCREFPSADKLVRQHQDCNIQVAYPTTSANLFHLLRRQQHRQFRKPLALFFSKQLLRHPLSKSSLEEFTNGRFEYLLEDPEHGKAITTKEDTKRLVLMSGQVYVKLHKHRQDINNTSTALVRIEELHPFPYAQLLELINSYPNLEDIAWCQEEPFNMGGWAYAEPRIQTILKETEKYKDVNIRYCGKNPNAAIASGTKATHHEEDEMVMKMVFKE